MEGAIHWLVQSKTAHPQLARGFPPPGLLSPPESNQLAGLKVEKRRQDWLLGRWTAKRLLQAYCERETGKRLPLETFIVANDPDGAPFAGVIALPADFVRHGYWVDPNKGMFCPAQPAKGADGPRIVGRLGLCLSISHSRGKALGALSGLSGVRVGADIEYIEPRSPRFVADYFTQPEIDLIRAAPADLVDPLVTVIWSAKEAVLKVFRLGLTVDTRRLSCLIRLADLACHPTQTADPAVTIVAPWFEVDISCDDRLFASCPTGNTQLRGWWQIADGFVMTLAAL